MISGIMDFTHGGLTEPSLADSEIRELIHIAHEEGFPVMAHYKQQSGSRAAALQVWTVSNMETSATKMRFRHLQLPMLSRYLR